MEGNKKPARSRLKGMQKLSSDNEGNNENNDDSEVIIAAACGERFGTMCAYCPSQLYGWLFFLKDMYNYMIFYQLIYSLSLSALFCLSVRFCESSRVFTF